MNVDSEKIYDNDAQTAVMKSTKEHWNGLTLFVEYPELPMDKNLMENGIRPCALELNNFLGNHSIRGGNLTVCMYSIIQTCLLNNINHGDYLCHYFNVCANNRGSMDSDGIRGLPYIQFGRSYQGKNGTEKKEFFQPLIFTKKASPFESSDILQ